MLHEDTIQLGITCGRGVSSKEAFDGRIVALAGEFIRLATFGYGGVPAGVGGLGWTSGVRADDPGCREGRDAALRFLLLGDLHFDKMAHHDMEWVRCEKPGDVRQIKGYVSARRSATRASSPRCAPPSKRHRRPVAVRHPGRRSRRRAVRQLRPAGAAIPRHDAAIDAAALGVPFLVTKGNHDITGPGAAEAFNEVFLPWLGSRPARQLRSANYVHRHGEDVFVFFDAYKPDLDWLDATLQANTAGAARVLRRFTRRSCRTTRGQLARVRRRT